jgi:hypothetical protein
MKSFKTKDGVEWTVEVTVGTVKRCLAETGLKLTDLFAADKRVGAFFADDVQFCLVLAAVIRPQLEERGKTTDDFLSVIDGTCVEQAVEALIGEVADFFPEPRKGQLKKMLAKYQAAHEKVRGEDLAEAERVMETIDFETLIRQTRMNSASSSQDSAA